MRISDWSSDVCSSDLGGTNAGGLIIYVCFPMGPSVSMFGVGNGAPPLIKQICRCPIIDLFRFFQVFRLFRVLKQGHGCNHRGIIDTCHFPITFFRCSRILLIPLPVHSPVYRVVRSRSEEHTSELQSLMRISYAVFCLKKKNTHTNTKL